MKTVMLIVLLVPALAVAQPSGSGSGSASATPGSGAGAEPAPGSAGAGSGSAAPSPSIPPVDEPVTGDAATLRKTCAAAMNANPDFAETIIRKAEIQLKTKVDSEQVKQDLCKVYNAEQAQAQIAKNERHVILAYAAMWLVAAGLVLFLWRRQMVLKTEIAHLRRDLEAATKDGGK